MDKTKLYCFVDENGQETEGRLFIVSVVLVKKEKEELLEFCERVEKESGKGKFKWRKAEYSYRLEYLRRLFNDNRLKGNICYSVFEDTKGYDLATIIAIARAVNYRKPMQDYGVAVYVDGLSKTKRREYSAELRKLGISTHKVQGVTKDENNSLVRFADAVAGFVRDVLDGDRGEAKKLFEQAVRAGALIECES